MTLKTVGGKILEEDNSIDFSKGEQYTGKKDKQGKKIYCFPVPEYAVAGTGNYEQKVTGLDVNVIADCWIDNSLSYFGIVTTGVKTEFKQISSPSANASYVLETRLEKRDKNGVYVVHSIGAGYESVNKWFHVYICYTKVNDE